MGGDLNVQVEQAGVERKEVRVSGKAALFYRNFVTRVIELGEIARIEIEIQNRFLHGAAPPRCPSWHHHNPPHGPEAHRAEIRPG
jgi:hypothetical protein